MTTTSSKEFTIHQEKYFDVAINEDIAIQEGEPANEYDEILEPDEDFYRAISMDEFRKMVKEDIHQIYSAGK